MVGAVSRCAPSTEMGVWSRCEAWLMIKRVQFDLIEIPTLLHRQVSDLSSRVQYTSTPSTPPPALHVSACLLEIRLAEDPGILHEDYGGQAAAVCDVASAANNSTNQPSNRIERSSRNDGE